MGTRTDHGIFPNYAAEAESWRPKENAKRKRERQDEQIRRRNFIAHPGNIDPYTTGSIFFLEW